MSRNTTRRTRSWIAAMALIAPGATIFTAGMASAAVPPECFEDPAGSGEYRCLYNAPNTAATFDVPDGVTSVTISAIGGGGGAYLANAGGNGALVSCTQTVADTDDILIYPGGAATGQNAGLNADPAVPSGDGFNGDGGRGGGGASTNVYLDPAGAPPASLLIVAGGGGGAGANGAGLPALTTTSGALSDGTDDAGTTEGGGGGGGTSGGAGGAADAPGAGGGSTATCTSDEALAVDGIANGSVEIRFTLPLVDAIAACADPDAPAPAGYEKIVGDPILGDVLEGGSGQQIIFGLGGNDQIDGGSGHDILCGGDGNDIINAGSGNDRVSGGPENDVISGGSGDDIIRGGDGNDTIDGGSGTNDIN